MGAADASMKHIARVQIARATEVSSSGVKNPMFTPARNFWGFTIYDSNMLRLMSESWAGLSGRRCRDLGVLLNPVLKAYNQGNGAWATCGLTAVFVTQNCVDGEAAINHVDIGFMLSTRLVVTAPMGFFFPSICRSLRITLPFMRELQNGTSYMFRALVVNPRDTFTDVTSPDKYWRIESQYADGTMVDLNRVIPSFAILSRLRYFAAATLSQVGLASTTYRIHFRTDQSLPPQQTVHIYPPAGTTFGGLNGACINTDPVLLSLQFPTPLISGAWN
ncbi:unnamed protein product [Effrenium voratum]|uniref:Uncharacterized protein n=1 Tax=Effrenium voratum TaxID=2562239 RepID=A0AA36MYQ7_9DINO|nr:unnamed protein product [Effrenium voratum]